MPPYSGRPPLESFSHRAFKIALLVAKRAAEEYRDRRQRVVFAFASLQTLVTAHVPGPNVWSSMQLDHEYPTGGGIGVQPSDLRDRRSSPARSSRARCMTGTGELAVRGGRPANGLEHAKGDE